MIAKIYPSGHPDLQGKKDPSHPVRYFDIRKFTPRECFRLMGVPEKFIDLLLSTDATGGGADNFKLSVIQIGWQRYCV